MLVKVLEPCNKIYFLAAKVMSCRRRRKLKIGENKKVLKLNCLFKHHKIKKVNFFFQKFALHIQAFKKQAKKDIIFYFKYLILAPKVKSAKLLACAKLWTPTVDPSIFFSSCKVVTLVNSLQNTFKRQNHEIYFVLKGFY